jgi:hypothetical protein
MTNETYMALAGCARRRIEQEWVCSAAERAVLGLITDLSFDLGQTWALVPCLADFAAVLDVHKSTVSRALRSALKKGFVLLLQRRDETLYSICTETRGTLRPADRGAGEAVRARLMQINHTRQQGAADGDGQQRIPGVLPSEEMAAPARAFAALLEVPEVATQTSVDGTKNVPCETISAPATRAHAGDDDDETNEEFQRRLEGMVRAAEKARGEEPAVMQPRSRDEGTALDKEMVKICRGLDSQGKHTMERLREEFVSGGKLQEAAFFKWGRLWRTRAKQYPRECLEVAGEHKNLRLTGAAANEPGAWMYRALQDLLGGVKA